MTYELIAKEAGKKFSIDIYNGVKAILSRGANIARADFQLGFGQYFEANIARCEKVKTIINRYQPVNIVEIYENSKFQEKNSDKPQISEENLVYEDEYRHIIVTGIAGCGKSFFMKRTFIRLCEDTKFRVPIFVELRHLNQSEKPDLMEYITEQLSELIPLFSKDLLDEMFKRCRICLLLDGFDELFTSARQKISKQIDRISYKYTDVKIIVSGRPDDRFAAWSTFTEYQVAPMSKEACLSLIQKASFPNDLRTKFSENVDQKLFNSHREYLQNPLLTYVMMLTSDQFSEFPNEISAFYNKAFEVLYSGHDIMKSGDYQREVKCNLKMKQLEKIIGYFCALSFADQSYEYNHKAALSYLEKAKTITNENFDSEDLLYDINKNYCMLILDGVNYSYIHRSFQEYLAATCLSESEIIDYFDYVNKLVSSHISSKRFVSMLREVGPEKFKRRYYLSALSIFVENLYPIRITQAKSFLYNIIDAYKISDDGRINVIYHGTTATFFNFIQEILNQENPHAYPSVFLIEENEALYKSMTEEENDDEILRIENNSDKNIKKLNIFKHYKSIVELAKKEMLAIEKRNTVLEKLVS